MLLLEDLGPKTVPPCTPVITRAVVRSFADIHLSTLSVTLPDWLRRVSTPYGPVWKEIAEESDGFARIAAAAGASASDAQRWLRDMSPVLF